MGSKVERTLVARRGVMVLLGAITLSLLYTWPLVSVFDSGVLCARSDAWVGMWLTDWFSHEFWQRGLSFDTMHLGYPLGVSLICADSWLLLLSGLLLVPVMGVTVFYNLWAVTSIIFTICVQYRVGRKWGMSPAAAFLSGALLGLSAATSNALVEGIVYILPWGLISLFVSQFWDLLRRGGWKKALASAATLSLAAYNTGYMGVICLAAGAMIILEAVAARGWRTIGAHLRPLGLFALLVAIICAPLVWAVVGSYDSGHGAVIQLVDEKDSKQQHLGRLASNSVVVSGFLLPRRSSGHGSYTSAYLGVAAIALALLALLRRGGGRVAVWLLLMLFGGFLAMGPLPGLTHGEPLSGPGRMPGFLDGYPLLVLGRDLPFTSVMGFPARYAALCHLGIAVLAGMGFDLLSPRRRWLKALVFMLVLLELLLLSGWPLRKEVQLVAPHIAFKELIKDPTPGAVLSVGPMTPDKQDPILREALFHHRPVAHDGYLKTGSSVSSLMQGVIWLRVQHKVTRGKRGLSGKKLKSMLQKLGFRYVVLYRETLREAYGSMWLSFPTFVRKNFPKDPGPELTRLLDKDLGRGRRSGGGVIVYKVAAPPGGVKLRRICAVTQRDINLLRKGDADGFLRRVRPPCDDPHRR